MTKAIAILDIGKTNKKAFLFDEYYNILWERSTVCGQTTDEDGDPCEDIDELTDWVYGVIAELDRLTEFDIRGINCSAYGASFVCIGEDGLPVAPLYNYLKPFPDVLKKKFYGTYGGEVTFSMLTASPVLGSLNSGMQLYRIKEEQPELFASIRTALHLPQYIGYLFTGREYSDITSIGCHTNLWNFSQRHYHEWVYREGIIDKLAPLAPSDSVHPLQIAGATWPRIPLAGVGLHDSSAALIPYLGSFRDPFALISTGTWCITLNPFNDAPLTVGELQRDCLCYMGYQGRPVKASRLFAGYEHEQRVRQLAAHFQKDPGYAATISYDAECVEALRKHRTQDGRHPRGIVDGASPQQIDDSGTFEEAYHRLMIDIMEQQVASTQLVLHDTGVRRIFVDGGFGKNPVYMHLLADAFPDKEIFAASIPQASALGAALAIHEHWNPNPNLPPSDLIELKYYR